MRFDLNFIWQTKTYFEIFHIGKIFVSRNFDWEPFGTRFSENFPTMITTILLKNIYLKFPINNPSLKKSNKNVYVLFSFIKIFQLQVQKGI